MHLHCLLHALVSWYCVPLLDVLPSLLQFLAACRSLNKALTKLAKMYPTVSHLTYLYSKYSIIMYPYVCRYVRTCVCSYIPLLEALTHTSYSISRLKVL